jgi:ABC-type uncharacterized transport system substrate-binding protein
MAAPRAFDNVAFTRNCVTRHRCAAVRDKLCTMMSLFRIILIALTSFVFAAPARAHPHVWITMKSELIYAPDGALTGVRQTWAFDDMFSAFSTQGYDSKEKGKFTREELAPLAKVNVESLKEYDYFTYVTADGVKVPLADPAEQEYWLDYNDSILTLHFTLLLKTPVKAKYMKIEIYDPTIFIDFEFAKDAPARLVGAPSGCRLDVALPRQMTFQEEKRLADADVSDPGAWGQAFANNILVNCP